MFSASAQHCVHFRPVQCSVPKAAGSHARQCRRKSTGFGVEKPGLPRGVSSGLTREPASPRGQFGFSLTELMVTLAAAGVLMGMAIPEFTALAAAQRASARINAVGAAIHTARHLAVVHNQAVTLCPGQGPACGAADHWHEGMLIFADTDGDLHVDDGEFVGARLPKLDAGETIVWRSFGNRSHLRFRGTGLTDWQPGNFQYCPADGDPRFARQLIVNAQGRVRQATDMDGDGIREDAQGRPLEC